MKEKKDMNITEVAAWLFVLIITASIILFTLIVIILLLPM